VSYHDEFKEKYGIEPDNTPDAARACFFSFDPDIYVNPDALPLSTSVLPKGSDSLKAINFRQMKMDEIDGAIEFIRNMKITYQEWISCGFALVSEFGRDGKEYFIHLSDNPNFPDFTVEKASAKYDELLLNSQNQVNIESLFHIAQKYGFIFSEDYNKYISYLPLEDKKPFSFADELRNRFKFDDERDPNILLGFQLKKFRELAQHIDGIQPGFYLLGAESNVGKTAVLTNICLDAIDTNPDISVIYFSLDDSRIYTVYRLLSILTGYNINDVRKKQNDSVKKAHLDEKREEIIKLIESGRLVIKDVAEVQHVKDLEKEIKAITDKSKLMVFIDGLYNLEVAEKAMGIREENIERARIIKQLVDTYRIPIFTTGELRKKAKEEGKDKAPTLNDLMETGKFAYNANVVWLLYGKQEDLKTPEPMLTLEYVKNKLSDYKSEQVLVFKRSTGTITEISLSDASSGFGLERPKTPLFEDNGGLI
jgi:replicative DNA helicase